MSNSVHKNRLTKFIKLILFLIIIFNLTNGQNNIPPPAGGFGCDNNSTLPGCGPVPVAAAPPPPSDSTAAPSVLLVPKCPAGTQVLKDPDGRAVTCLPHYNNRCVGANSCCYFNKIDYYCCPGVAPADCPNYADSTVIIYRRTEFSPNLNPPAPPNYPPQLYDSIFARPPGPKPGFFSGYGLGGSYNQYPGQPGPPIQYQPNQNQGSYKGKRSINFWHSESFKNSGKLGDT